MIEKNLASCTNSKTAFFGNIPKNYIAAAIFLIIFFILGVPFTQWGFKTDDWANILHSKLEAFEDAIALFTEGNMETLNYASNWRLNRGSFLSGLYRPLSFIFYYPQTLVFGSHAYGYFLTTIFLHGLNSITLFFILSKFFNHFSAIFGTLFFAFHPSLQNWLGWVSAQTYFIEFFILQIIFIFFYTWLRSKKISFYIGAVALFFLNLLLKEATICLPAWIFISMLFYQNSLSLKSLQKAFFGSLGFTVAACGYFLIRLSFMPFTAAQSGTLGFHFSWQSFLVKQSARILQFITYTYDLLSLTWLPKGNRVINGSIFLVLIMFIGYLFIKSNKQKSLLYCIFSIILFSWPVLLMHYQPRYIYMAIPWVAAALIILIKPLMQKKHFFLAAFITTPIYLTGSALYIFSNMRERESILHRIDTSFRKLLLETLPQAGWHHTPLYFFGLPTHWFDMGTAQAIWLIDELAVSCPIYQGGGTVYMPQRNDVREMPQSDKPTDKVTAKIVNADQRNFAIELTSKNLQKFAFAQTPREEKFIEEIDPLLTQDGLFLITWDYNKGEFMLAGKIPPQEDL